MSTQVNQKLTAKTQEGFTLIELSIVLVIIGLIIGGILTGQDLINAAAIRAQISQIEKYNTAVRTFQGKYGYLPGDIPNPYATQFGFITRGSCEGFGDGNGIIEGNLPASCQTLQLGQRYSAGETTVFWVDLSQAGLIDGTFNTATSSTDAGNVATPSALQQFFPQAKIGQGNFVIVYSGGYAENRFYGTTQGDGTNYFAVQPVTTLNAWLYVNQPSMTVNQAYNIDKKVDDGWPQSGNVMAMYLNYNATSGGVAWAAGGSNFGDQSSEAPVPSPATTAYATTNCYDASTTPNVESYSTAKNGSQPNCALSFRFQ